MKFITHLLLLFYIPTGVVQGNWKEETLFLLEQAQEDPSKKNIIRLGDQFGGYLRGPNFTDEQVETSRKAIDFLISVPGHSRWRIEAMERDIADPKMNYHEISAVKARYQRPIASMPSPETVWLSGAYLYDFRGEHKIRDYDHPFAIGAANWLISLQIREFPVRKYIYFDRDALIPVQEWWEAVKVGKKDVSFVGRPEIYRFKEDGSWEMVGKVDAGIVEKELAAKREERRVFRESLEKDRARQRALKLEPPQKPDEKAWIESVIWIGVCALLAIILAWFACRYIRRLN